MGIFGFCDIRNFTDATEVLQEDVMIFVNQIGEIVHNVVDSYSGAPNKNIGDASICHAYGGSANKNIGDAFLLVWKFDEKDIVRESKGDLFLMQTNRVQ